MNPGWASCNPGAQIERIPGASGWETVFCVLGKPDDGLRDPQGTGNPVRDAARDSEGSELTTAGMTGVPADRGR
jgi:hypothetical protein